MDVLITGATGLVGSRLVDEFERVAITSRNAQNARSKFPDDNVNIIQWDYKNEDLSLNELGGVKAIVNLMGESVAKGRWTDDKKKRMRDSRVEATRKLVDAIGRMDVKPEVMVSASAVGFYGDHGNQEIDESGVQGNGFLAELSAQWEEAAKEVEKLGIRLVIIRIGVVLSDKGGALAEMLPIFRLGAGGRLGSGKQFFPWIHIDDLVNMICWAIQTSKISGVCNATSPSPATNGEFTKSLARTIGRPAFIPVPRFGLRLAFGEFADSLFASQRVVPRAALENGFKFEFSDLDVALKNLLK